MALYDKRLATRISRGVDNRLRLLAHLRGQRLCQVLDSVLGQHLPSAEELREQLRDGGQR